MYQIQIHRGVFTKNSKMQGKMGPLGPNFCPNFQTKIYSPFANLDPYFYWIFENFEVSMVPQLD